MTYGTYARAHPRLIVLRGLAGNEPTNLTRSAPIDPTVTLGTLFSGMVISINSSGNWILGAPDGTPAYLAWHDDTDPDVAAVGKLLGISLLGNYEVQTAFVDTTQAFVDGSPVIANSGNAGSLTIGVLNNSHDILGFATNGGIVDLSTINSEAASGTASKVLQFAFKYTPKHS